jgi:hypothetical protein
MAGGSCPVAALQELPFTTHCTTGSAFDNALSRTFIKYSTTDEDE